MTTLICIAYHTKDTVWWGHKLKTRSLPSPRPHWGSFCHLFACISHNLPAYEYEVTDFIHSKDMEGALIVEQFHETYTTPNLVADVW